MNQLTQQNMPHSLNGFSEIRRPYQVIDFEKQQFFWSRTRRDGEHLIWTGSYASRNYGFMYFEDNRREYVHRVAYCIARGIDLKDIEGQIILRTCDLNDCVEPSHLVAKKKKQK